MESLKCSTWSPAPSSIDVFGVSGGVNLEQAESVFDGASNLLQQTQRQRCQCSAGADDQSRTIDGAATFALSAQWQTLRIVSDGANWLVV